MSAEEDPHGTRGNANRDAQHGQRPHLFSERGVGEAPLGHPGVPAALIEGHALEGDGQRLAAGTVTGVGSSYGGLSAIGNDTFMVHSGRKARPSYGGHGRCHSRSTAQNASLTACDRPYRRQNSTGRARGGGDAALVRRDVTVDRLPQFPAERRVHF